MYAPIAIFAYNRLDHFRQTIRHLLFNKEARNSYLYVFSDGAKLDKDKAVVDEIRAFVAGIQGFRKVFLVSNEMNLGLKTSIKKGVTHVLEQHDSVIVLEDDISVNGNFLGFHNQCLTMYKDLENIWSISGYVIPGVGEAIHEKTGEKYFLTRRASSWGWSTWKDRWEKVIWNEQELFTYLGHKNNYGQYYETGGDKIRMLLDRFEKKNNSWAIIWDFNHFIQRAYCLYPYKSFVRNIGLDHTGVHSKPRSDYNVALENWGFDPAELPSQPIPSDYVLKKFRTINSKFYRDILDRLRFRRLKKDFKG